MLLRNSISNTRRFFKKTLQRFRSFFYGDSTVEHAAADYQKLPKTSSFNPLDMNQTSNFQELEDFYSDFTHRWELESSKPKKSTSKEGNASTGVMNNVTIRRKKDEYQKGNCKVENEDDLYSKSRRETRCLTVARKLKEMEMMDMSNVDHVLDIEEILHYYSRLTCPLYVDIVDRFFIDMYKEFHGPSAASPKTVNSKPKYRSVRA